MSLSLMMWTTSNSATAVQRTAVLLERQVFKFVYPVYARYTALETIVKLINIEFFCGNDFEIRFVNNLLIFV